MIYDPFSTRSPDDVGRGTRRDGRLPAGLLEAYAALVRRWAPRLDLVAGGDLARFEERHIDDSLKAAKLIESAPEGPCIDVGSGAGLPGVVLAIAGPQRHWRLLEPRRKRAGFLEEVVRELDLDCEVVGSTAEQAARSPRFAGAHAVATARALAPPAAAAALVVPWVAPAGVGVIFVGRDGPLPPGSTRWSPGIAIIRKS